MALTTITAEGTAAVINAQATGASGVVIATCGVVDSGAEIKILTVEGVELITPGLIRVGIKDQSADIYTAERLNFYLDDTATTLFATITQMSQAKAADSIFMALMEIDVSAAGSSPVTPSGAITMSAPVSTTEIKGIIETATVAESTAGAVSNLAVTPEGMRAHGDARYYFPSGTKMVFYQESAPTGWTIDATNTDSALRVVNTTTVNITSADAIDDTISYRIKTVSGDTDFTAIGAASNTVGVIFKPTPGVDSFTGAGILTIGGGGMPGGLAGFSSAFSHGHGDATGNTSAPLKSHSHGYKDVYGIQNGATTVFPTGGGSMSLGLSVRGPSGSDDNNTHGDYRVDSTDDTGDTSDSHNHTITSATISPKYVDVIICIKS